MSNKANTFVHRIKISPPSRKKREAGIRRGYAVPSNLVFFIWRNLCRLGSYYRELSVHYNWTVMSFSLWTKSGKILVETNYQKSSKKIAIKQIYFFYFFESRILHFKIGITQDYAFLKQIMNSVNAYADLKVWFVFCKWYITRINFFAAWETATL